METSLSSSTVFSIPLQGRGVYPSCHFLSILVCDQPVQQSWQFCNFSFFFVGYYKVWSSGRDEVIRLSVKIPMEFVSHSSRHVGLLIYYLFVGSNLNFLNNSEWITLPTQACPVLYISVLIYCTCLLCDWSFRLHHHINYICYCVVSYLFWLWYDWFLWRCFCAAIKRDSASLLGLPFLSHAQAFSCEMLLIGRLKRP